jgi:hypothetical protein
MMEASVVKCPKSVEGMHDIILDDVPAFLVK